MYIHALVKRDGFRMADRIGRDPTQTGMVDGDGHLRWSGKPLPQVFLYAATFGKAGHVFCAPIESHHGQSDPI